MKDLPLFDGLKPEERMKILDLAVKREFEPGHLLFEEGKEKEALYLITRGQVKLWKSLPGGKRVTIWIAGPEVPLNAFPEGPETTCKSSDVEIQAADTGDLLTEDDFPFESGKKVAETILDKAGL